jgi:hypothetical protein
LYIYAMKALMKMDIHKTGIARFFEFFGLELGVKEKLIIGPEYLLRKVERMTTGCSIRYSSLCGIKKIEQTEKR